MLNSAFLFCFVFVSHKVKQVQSAGLRSAALTDLGPCSQQSGWSFGLWHPIQKREKCLISPSFNRTVQFAFISTLQGVYRDGGSGRPENGFLIVMEFTGETLKSIKPQLKYSTLRPKLKKADILLELSQKLAFMETDTHPVTLQQEY